MAGLRILADLLISEFEIYDLLNLEGLTVVGLSLGHGTYETNQYPALGWIHFDYLTVYKLPFLVSVDDR